jgi:ribulose-5-phosphate 4-epimerase/fuculose-1-phosphate aldolase
MFPSFKLDDGVLVTARSTPKDKLQVTDFVPTKLVNGDVQYYGVKEQKPSIDTPVQLKLYERYPQFNFMIHGHAYIDIAITLDKYYPCGDMREFDVICDYMDKLTASIGHPPESIVLNLKNHGFLMMTSTLNRMSVLVDKVVEFKYRDLGETI